jgi:multiple sugar transport system ATP-binding protein
MNFLGEKFASDYGATTIGIRSEHVEVGDGQPWTGEVVHVEDLGSDHFLFVDIGSEEPLICRRMGKTKFHLGDKLSVGPMMDHLHRFGADGKPVK